MAASDLVCESGVVVSPKVGGLFLCCNRDLDSKVLLVGHEVVNDRVDGRHDALVVEGTLIAHVAPALLVCQYVLFSTDGTSYRILFGDREYLLACDDRLYDLYPSFGLLKNSRNWRK